MPGSRRPISVRRQGRADDEARQITEQMNGSDDEAEGSADDGSRESRRGSTRERSGKRSAERKAGKGPVTATAMPASTMLIVQALRAGYGKGQVLDGLDLSVGEGEIVGLLGRNGAGRSTTVRAIMGLVAGQGSVRFRGVELLGLRPFEIARAGIAYVPEDRQVFPSLTVEQNLRLGERRRERRSENPDERRNDRWEEQRDGKREPPASRPPAWRIDDIYAIFPQLAERRRTAAGVLSGGEQQMLTLGRSLLGNPALMLIDEPTEGLAPRLVEAVAGFLQRLKASGVSVLLIEQKLTIALEISQRVYVMGHGRVVFEGSPAALVAAPGIRHDWLEV